MARGNRHFSHMNDGFESSEPASSRAARRTRAQRNASEARRSYGEVADAAQADRERRLDRAAYPHGKVPLPRQAVEGRAAIDPSSPRVRAAQRAQGREAVFAQQAQARAAAAERNQQDEMMRQMARRAQAMKREQTLNEHAARQQAPERAARRAAAQAAAAGQSGRPSARRSQSDRPAVNPLYTQDWRSNAPAAQSSQARPTQPGAAQVPGGQPASRPYPSADRARQPRPAQLAQAAPSSRQGRGYPASSWDDRAPQYPGAMPSAREDGFAGYGSQSSDFFAGEGYGGGFGGGDFGGNGFGPNGNGFGSDGRSKKRRVPKWIMIVLMVVLLLVGVGAIWVGTGHGLPFIHPAASSHEDSDSNEKPAVNDKAGDKSEKSSKKAAEEAEKGQVVMTLHGNADTKVMLGEDYIESGCQAIDKTDGDITDSVVAEGKVDTSKEGDYTVTYTATNSEGKIATATRTVHVGDFEADQDGVSVLMYHYVYTADDVPDDLNSNYILDTDLAQHLEYLVEQDYYFPSYQELRAYIEGTHSLPANSVVLTFDDAQYGFLDYGIPVLEKYKVPATSFVIGDRDGASTKPLDYASPYVNFQSHSYGLHNAGSSAEGHGGLIYDLSEEELVEDLTSMDSIVHSREAFAYPYGDVSSVAPDAVAEVGILCAFTTEYGQVGVGDDPTLLSRIRVLGDSGFDSFPSLL